MKEYSVSIITVNLNNKAGLLKTIRSIQNQTFNEIDYIVIDGGSTDGSKELIEQTQFISKWVCEEDEGIYDAMNKGIGLATGEYLLFLNSGDCLHDNATLEKIVPLLNQFDIIYGDLFFADKLNPYIYHYPSELSFSFLFNASLAHPATFIKRDLFGRFGQYDTRFQIVADWAFFINVIVKKNASTKHIKQIISDFDTNGISSRAENQLKIANERKAVLEIEFPLFYQDYLTHANTLNTLEKIRSSSVFRFLKKIGIKRFQ